MTPNATIDSIKNDLGAPTGAHLGDLCWWELEDARCARTTLENLWLGAGLDAEYLPEAPTDQRALRHAVESLSLRGTSILVRPSLKDAGQICYAVVEETENGDGTNKYNHLATVKLCRGTGTCTTDAQHNVAQQIVSMYATLRDSHSTDEVRLAIIRCVRDGCKGAALRRAGGFYWVPAAHSTTLRALQSVVEKLGASTFYPFPLHASAEAVRAVSASAQDALKGELRALHDLIAKYAEKPADRKSTYEHRFEDIAALRDRASLYQTVLSVEVSDLESEIAGLETTLQGLLDAQNNEVA